MGQGLKLLLGLLWAQVHKMSRETVVQYGTWFLFPVLLSNLGQSFALGAPLVLSVFVSSLCGCNFVVS